MDARREYRMAQANADKKVAQAQIDALRDKLLTNLGRLTDTRHIDRDPVV
jgi:hypothetical protein